MAHRLRPVAPIWVAGRPQHGEEEFFITHPWDSAPVGATSWATPAQVETAIATAWADAEECAELPAHVRAAALDHVRRRLAEETENLAELICAESGKPITWARVEVNRAVSTFRWAAEEARRFSGSLQRLDTDPGAVGRMAMVRHFPRGPVLGITPFNFPLNLVAHKVAPAIAAGCPIVIKPAPATPLVALHLAAIVSETGLPPGALSVLPVPNERAEALVNDPRLPVLSFTGSEVVGNRLRAQVPTKHLTLELGGNGAALVTTNYPDRDWAAQRIATFGNYQAGQSCIAAQRIYIEEAAFSDMRDRIMRQIAELGTGDPSEATCKVGPLINEAAAKRVADWVAEAVAEGATLLTGGAREGATVEPTLLTDVDADSKVMREEIFGPVLVLQSVRTFEEGLAAINDSRFGLQAGVFTDSMSQAMHAHRTLQVGGVIIGDVPSFRADQMPYGGIKESGVGREGVASAMRDYTYQKVMVIPHTL
ncbi:aldehyde dehydrogenase family protein [Natronoglycomyces albus]|uniref:Aldehyde dehydrogenase family protein n=1 Tax=Natronoglycomyces albus TaxID=2811108 RepID=A0A895XHV7_9ACTN|nr:aldehyde dehydrogenase family protein [Natronoglycomyces albus]QSB05411.1 aldehyde dehydrogenase family protein [Natronoglycomyces albus]